MDQVSVWHWLVILVVVAAPLLLLVRHRRQRATAAVANVPPEGIGGWLKLFAFMLCLGFMLSIAELAKGMPDYLAGFRNEQAHGPLVAIGLMALAARAVHLWAIVALFQKKRVLRKVYATMWILTFLTPFMLLSMLTVPGVRLYMVLPDEDVAKLVVALIVMSVWYWYLRASVRVKNTLVN